MAGPWQVTLSFWHEVHREKPEDHRCGKTRESRLRPFLFFSRHCQVLLKCGRLRTLTGSHLQSEDQHTSHHMHTDRDASKHTQDIQSVDSWKKSEHYWRPVGALNAVRLFSLGWTCGIHFLALCFCTILALAGWLRLHFSMQIKLQGVFKGHHVRYYFYFNVKLLCCMRGCSIFSLETSCKPVSWGASGKVWA